MKIHRDSPDALIHRTKGMLRESLQRIALLEKGMKRFPKNGWIFFLLAVSVEGKDPERAERPPEKPGPGVVELVVSLLGRDAPVVRILASRAFLHWDGDLMRERIGKHLKDKDPFRKRLAFLAAISRLGKEGLRVAKKRLRSKWDLYWYDAMTGLARSAGRREGRSWRNT